MYNTRQLQVTLRKHVCFKQYQWQSSITPILRYSTLHNKEDLDVADARSWLASFSPAKIPRSICEIDFARSSGPGGQNVNKVNSKATLRLELKKCSQFMPEFVLQRFKQNGKRYFSKDKNDLIIQSDSSRKQSENVEECFRKLYREVVESLALPGETSKEQSQHVGNLKRKENEARIKMKKFQSSKKASRRGDNQ